MHIGRPVEEPLNIRVTIVDRGRDGFTVGTGPVGPRALGQGHADPDFPLEAIAYFEEQAGARPRKQVVREILAKGDARRPTILVAE